jgi:hypothetical protein
MYRWRSDRRQVYEVWKAQIKSLHDDTCLEGFLVPVSQSGGVLFGTRTLKFHLSDGEYMLGLWSQVRHDMSCKTCADRDRSDIDDFKQYSLCYWTHRALLYLD